MDVYRWMYIMDVYHGYISWYQVECAIHVIVADRMDVVHLIHQLIHLFIEYSVIDSFVL